MPIPSWRCPPYEAGEMGRADEWATTEGGIGSIDLMERAGEGLARAVERGGGEGPLGGVVGGGGPPAARPGGKGKQRGPGPRPPKGPGRARAAGGPSSPSPTWRSC